MGAVGRLPSKMHMVYHECINPLELSWQGITVSHLAFGVSPFGATWRTGRVSPSDYASLAALPTLYHRLRRNNFTQISWTQWFHFVNLWQQKWRWQVIDRSSSDQSIYFQPVRHSHVLIQGQGIATRQSREARRGVLPGWKFVKPPKSAGYYIILHLPSGYLT